MKLPLIKETPIYRQMTKYGQNKGYFIREKNECNGTEARTKLQKIIIVVYST